MTRLVARLAYLSPISPLYRPYISPISPKVTRLVTRLAYLGSLVPRGHQVVFYLSRLPSDGALFDAHSAEV